jgi:hypothetical protein
MLRHVTKGPQCHSEERVHKMNVNHYEAWVVFLLKKLPGEFTREVKPLMYSNVDPLQYAHLEQLIVNTLREGGFHFDEVTMHLEWKRVLAEVIRRRDEITG